jgi:hypothetical protein
MRCTLIHAEKENLCWAYGDNCLSRTLSTDTMNNSTLKCILHNKFYTTKRIKINGKRIKSYMFKQLFNFIYVNYGITDNLAVCIMLILNNCQHHSLRRFREITSRKFYCLECSREAWKDCGTC